MIAAGREAVNVTQATTFISLDLFSPVLRGEAEGPIKHSILINHVVLDVSITKDSFI